MLALADENVRKFGHLLQKPYLYIKLDTSDVFRQTEPVFQKAKSPFMTSDFHVKRSIIIITYNE